MKYISRISFVFNFERKKNMKKISINSGIINENK